MPSSTALVLSSGFLAFARHVGVARGLEKAGIVPDRISGVSSGALIGALLAAGHGTSALSDLLAQTEPRALLRLRFPLAEGVPGLFSLDPLVAWLRRWLPERFEDLRVPFSVGVIDRAAGRKALIESGPLAEAVAASCAIPWFFAPRRLEGRWMHDGGVADRLFLAPLLERHPAPRVIAHLVCPSRYRAARRQALVETQLREASASCQLTRVVTGRSEASFRSLGDVGRQIEEASTATLDALRTTG
jgi:NTE family protein